MLQYKKKFIFIILIILLLPCAVNAYITVRANYYLKDEIYNRLSLICELNKDKINNFINFQQQENRLIAEDLARFHIINNKDIGKYLSEISRNNGYEGILLLTSEGKVVASSAEGLISDSKTSIYIQNIKGLTPNNKAYLYIRNINGQVYTDIDENGNINKKRIFLFTPIKFSDRLSGFMVTVILFTEMKKSLLALLSSFYGDFYLINKKGDVILGTYNELPEVINIKDIEDQLKKPEIGTYKNFKNEKVVGAYKPINNMGWILVYEMQENSIMHSIQELNYRNLMLNLFVILVVYLIASFASRNISNPLKEVFSAVNMITEGNLKARVNIKTGDELEELGKRFNSMVENLEILYNELDRKVQERTKELDEANKQLQEMNRLKSEFLANMSHELRTPLNSIIGFSELMADKIVGELNEDQEQCVKDILESGRHLLQLINDILDLSKVEAGKMELHCEDFSIRESINVITRTLNSLVEKKNQSLSYNVQEDVSNIYADQGKIKQIIINLLSNAIKFTPEGGKIHVNVEKKEEHILISVSDTGIGIKEEDLKYIFEEFRQVDGSYTREQEGTGLGLALTKKFIELHRGKIWVESKVDKGTIFYFTIPHKE